MRLAGAVSGDGAVNRKLASRPFAVLVAGLAALPVVAATVQAIAQRWTPVSDDGFVALRAFDVFSTHSPLLGQWSQASPLAGAATYSPGPLLYWAFSVPAHVGAVPLVTTAGAISAASIVGSVMVARQIGGAGLMLAAAGVLAIMTRSLPGEVPYELWNCWAGFFPFVLAVFLAWAVACGRYRLLAPLVLAGSYAVQCHLTYALPVAGAILVALTGLCAHLHRTGYRDHLGRWLGAAAVVVVVCWAAPVLDQIEHSPGNLTRLTNIATSDHPKYGTAAGTRMVARAVGVRPLWLRAPRSVLGRVDEFKSSPRAINAFTAPVVLLALVGVLALAVRRHHGEAVAGAALALVLCAALLGTAAAVPKGNLGIAAATYSLTWASFAGAFAYLALGYGFAVLASVGAGRAFFERPAVVGLAVAAVVVASVGASVRSVDDSNRLPPGYKNYAAIRTAVARGLSRLNPHEPVLLDAPFSFSGGTTSVQSAIAYALRRNGIPFALPPRVTIQSGGQYCPRERRYRQLVVIADRGIHVPLAAAPVARFMQTRIYVVRGDARLERQARDDVAPPFTGSHSFYRSACRT